jgi:hypothetical protein
VAWETKDGNRYYYRSVRDGERVRKEYVGKGEIAELIAHATEARRLAREDRRERERDELERLEALVAPVQELDGQAEALVGALLVAAGYRKRKGEWRLRRGD